MRSARCLRRVGTRRRWSGSSSPTTTVTPRRRCARSCASSTRTAAWSGSRRTRSGRPRTSYILHSEIYDGESQDAQPWIRDGRQSRMQLAGRARRRSNPSRWRFEAQDFRRFAWSARWRRSRSRSRSRAFTFTTLGRTCRSGAAARRGAGGHRCAAAFCRGCECGRHDLYRQPAHGQGDGSLHSRAAKACEEFTPQFTFHGFRYAELTGLPTAPGKDAVPAWSSTPMRRSRQSSKPAAP